MESLKVKFLMGPPDCNDPYIPTYSDLFLKELSKEIGFEVTCAEMDEVADQVLPVYFIASGGAELGFRACHEQTKEPYVLLTTPAYNSLPAAMEIMGYLQEHGKKGQILFGTTEEIAAELRHLLRNARIREKLGKQHLGCFGEPGGLIASDADLNALKERFGISMELYSLDELVEEFHKGGYDENAYTSELKTKGFDPAEVEKALNVYGALQRLIVKYGLTGVTVRCFDLLSAIHTTGCLALAILNAQGIPAACEGDQKALLSMAVMHVLTGEPGFMANPSYIDTKKNEITFAHCTLPLNMCDRYSLMTHFESGIGVAVSGDLTPQPMTIFKCNGDLSAYYAGKATLVETTHKTDLCRTQMVLKLDEGYEYFAKRPISNHHIIYKGDHKAILDEILNVQ